MEISPNSVMNFLIFSKNIFSFSKLLFSDENNKVRKKIGPLNRCRIVRGIDFSHPQSDSAKLSIRYRADKKVSTDFTGFPYHLRSDNDVYIPLKS